MRIDLDHHATTPVDPRVIDAMLPWWSKSANANSTQHASGRAARDAVETARAQIATALNCDPREIIFTSGATESNNLAVRGCAAGVQQPIRIVTNAAEHRAVLDPVRRRQREGAEVLILPVDAMAAVDPQSVRDALTPNTRLVSVMLANNEVGTINDLAAMACACQGSDSVLHTDAAQAIGQIPVDLQQLPVDLLSLTAHKLHGPQGVGALFVRRGDRRIALKPLIEGGGHEQGLRSGTLPVALIVGFGEAVRLACEEMAQQVVILAALRDQLWSGLAAIPGIHLNGPAIDEGHRPARLPNNLNISLEDVDGEALLVRLDQRDLNVSSGAACSTNNPEPSHVLRAMGLSTSLARASLRFGLSRFNTADEVDRAAVIVSDAIASLRAAGPEGRRPAEP